MSEQQQQEQWNEKDAVVISLAIAHAIQAWLRYVPGSDKQKLLGLQFASEIVREGGPTWSIPASHIMSSSNGLPSLSPYTRGTGRGMAQMDSQSQSHDKERTDEAVA